MRYRGGSEGSREVFCIHCNAEQKYLTEKGRCFNYSPERQAWVFLWSTDLNWGPQWTVFWHIQTWQFIWNVPERSEDTFLITSNFHLSVPSPCREKLTEGMHMSGVPGWVLKPLWRIQCVCPTDENCRSWDCSGTNSSWLPSAMLIFFFSESEKHLHILLVT